MDFSYKFTGKMKMVAIFAIISSIIVAVQGSESYYQKLQKYNSQGRPAEFTSESLERYAKSERNYSLIVLITTENPQVNCHICPLITAEYLRVADAFKAEVNKKGGYDSTHFQKNSVFFGKCDVMKCYEFYQKAEWKIFPVLFHLKPSSKESKQIDYRSIKVMDSVLENPDAASIADWVSNETKFKIEVDNTFYIVSTAAIYITFVVLLYLLVRKWIPKLWGLRKNPMFYFALSMLVFGSVMAGTVFNAIHKPPFSYRNPHTKQLMLIYPASRSQFVLEGFIMATLFISGGGLFVAVTELIPKISDPSKQRVIFFSLLLLFLIVWKLTMDFFKIKHSYYPLWPLLR